MPVLVRHCLTAIWPVFFTATGVIVLLFNLLFSLRELLNYFFHHAGLGNCLLLLLYLQPGYFILAMPIAFLVAVMIVYGRLSADGEVTALESCGFSVQVLIWPMILLSVFFSLFLVFFWDISLPWGNTSFLKLQYRIITERSTIIVRERTFIEDFPGYVLYAGSRDEKTETLKNVTIELLDEKGYPYRLIVAKTGKMHQDTKNYHTVMDLTDGVMQQVGESKTAAQEEFFQMQFKSCALDLNSNRLKSGPIDFRDPRNVSMAELAAEIAEQKKQNRDNRYYDVEFHKKISMPFSALAFAFIGIPLALIARASAFRGPFLAVILVFIYWFFDQYGENATVSPFWAMWCPNILLIAIGSLLIYVIDRRPYFWKRSPWKGWKRRPGSRPVH
jgi:lipopolysaccharide export system permease protein